MENEKNLDLLNQSFDSVDMNEKKDSDVIKFMDSSSEDGFDHQLESKSESLIT